MSTYSGKDLSLAYMGEWHTSILLSYKSWIKALTDFLQLALDANQILKYWLYLDVLIMVSSCYLELTPYSMAYYIFDFK